MYRLLREKLIIFKKLNIITKKIINPENVKPLNNMNVVSINYSGYEQAFLTELGVILCAKMDPTLRKRKCHVVICPPHQKHSNKFKTATNWSELPFFILMNVYIIL